MAATCMTQSAWRAAASCISRWVAVNLANCRFLISNGLPHLWLPDGGGSTNRHDPPTVPGSGAVGTAVVHGRCLSADGNRLLFAVRVVCPGNAVPRTDVFPDHLWSALR